MSPFLAELFGTAVLILLGDGVVANVVLRETRGHNSGWIVITAGWACAVTIAVYCVNSISGAHLNPAVTVALAATGAFPWTQVLPYIVAQVLGGFLGAVIVWLAYLPHWGVTPEADRKLAVFSTIPAIRASRAVRRNLDRPEEVKKNVMRTTAHGHPAIVAAVPTRSAAIAPPRDNDRVARAPNASAPARKNPASARSITTTPLCRSGRAQAA